MELTKLVEDGAVVASLNASERGPVVRELLESLAAAGRIDDSSVDPLHNAVMKRERKGSTGFGHGLQYLMPSPPWWTTSESRSA